MNSLVQFSPRELDLHPGSQGRIQLTYTPQQSSKIDALVSLVDDARQRPLEMLLVRLDSTATRISRQVSASGCEAFCTNSYMSGVAG